MTYSSEVLADSPIAWYRLGEASGTTAADSSGGGHAGTYGNTPTLGVTGALVGDGDTAVTFTAASSEDVRIAFWSGLQIATFTLEAWVKTTGSNQAILGRQGTNAPYQMFVDTTGKLSCIIKNSGTFTYLGSAVINDGNWHHCVITRDDTTADIKLYIDGALDSTSTGTVAPSLSSTVGLAIASRATTPFLNGTVDEPAVYNTVLSGTRVAAHYTAGASSTVSGTLAATLAGTTLAASGAETFSGTLAATLGDTTLAATGAETFTGTLASTLANTTLAATGSEAFSGTLATTLDDTTLAASGTVVISVTGTLATTLDDTQLAATGAETFTGTLSTTLDDTTLSASGSVAVPVTGTLAATLANITLAAVGTSLTVLPTPASRIYVIRRETRTSAILAETRTRTINAETRTLSIPTEPRTRTIPAEPRTLEVTT